MGNLEEDLAVPLDDNPAYDLRAVLDRGERDRLNGGPASSCAGDRVEAPRGMPPALVPHFEDVLNTGSPRPGTWIYLNEAMVGNGPLLPVLRMVYWDQESETWRRFMATPDCIEPVTVPQPWTGLRQPPTSACDSGQARGEPRARRSADHRDGERPEHGRRRRGPEFVRTSRPSMPTHDARVVRLAVQAFASLMVDRSNASEELPAPTLEEIATAVATVVHDDIVVRCDSSSSGGERAAVATTDNRRASDGIGYRPVRAAPSSAARRAPANPRPPVRRLPREWRYTDTLE